MLEKKLVNKIEKLGEKKINYLDICKYTFFFLITNLEKLLFAKIIIKNKF